MAAFKMRKLATGHQRGPGRSVAQSPALAAGRKHGASAGPAGRLVTSPTRRQQHHRGQPSICQSVEPTRRRVGAALKRGTLPSLVVNGSVEVKDSAVDLPSGRKTKRCQPRNPGKLGASAWRAPLDSVAGNFFQSQKALPCFVSTTIDHQRQYRSEPNTEERSKKRPPNRHRSNESRSNPETHASKCGQFSRRLANPMAPAAVAPTLTLTVSYLGTCRMMRLLGAVVGPSLMSSGGVSSTSSLRF